MSFVYGTKWLAWVAKGRKWPLLLQRSSQLRRYCCSRIGTYGVIAYSIAQRRREIGIRIALGADGRRVRELVFRQTFQILIVGFVAGLPCSLLLSRLYSSCYSRPHRVIQSLWVAPASS